MSETAPLGSWRTFIAFTAYLCCSGLVSYTITSCLPQADKAPIQIGATLACEGGLLLLGAAGEAPLCATVGELVAALATLQTVAAPAPSAPVANLRRNPPSVPELRRQILRQRGERP